MPSGTRKAVHQLAIFILLLSSSYFLSTKFSIENNVASENATDLIDQVAKSHFVSSQIEYQKLQNSASISADPEKAFAKITVSTETGSGEKEIVENVLSSDLLKAMICDAREQLVLDLEKKKMVPEQYAKCQGTDSFYYFHRANSGGSSEEELDFYLNRWNSDEINK